MRTHGLSRTAEHKVWLWMKERCNRVECKSYARYGGRGIRVCERWGLFENFLADMGKRPSSAHQIDRINSAGNYEPGNCRWVTTTQQNRNRRDNILIPYKGDLLPLPEVAEELGIPRKRLWWRLKHGWPLERALSEPGRQDHV